MSWFDNVKTALNLPKKDSETLGLTFDERQVIPGEYIPKSGKGLCNVSINDIKLMQYLNRGAIGSGSEFQSIHRYISCNLYRS